MEQNFDSTITREAETLKTLANLATASAADESAIAALTNTNAELAQELVQLRAENAALKKQLNENRKHARYCWSCGRNSDHWSSKRPKKKDGHEDRATATSMMGGNKAVCPRNNNCAEQK